eukprot:TRINITY_DN41331_c0_g1_i1.p1 TRINITY_DN41331_c0_g1~~TRINITY_DN41331_c0_g1_i1.p1  ORF type:complete len:364 (+),score=36.55 TRINITY_DN41331_c0_g1_i1:39-1094(+)
MGSTLNRSRAAHPDDVAGAASQPREDNVTAEDICGGRTNSVVQLEHLKQLLAYLMCNGCESSQDLSQRLSGGVSFLGAKRALDVDDTTLQLVIDQLLLGASLAHQMLLENAQFPGVQDMDARGAASDAPDDNASAEDDLSQTQPRKRMRVNPQSSWITSQSGSLTQLGVPAAQGTPAAPTTQPDEIAVDGISSPQTVWSSMPCQQLLASGEQCELSMTSDAPSLRPIARPTCSSYVHSQGRILVGQLSRVSPHGAPYVEGEITRVVMFREDRGFSVRLIDESGSVDVKFIGHAANRAKDTCPQVLQIGKRVCLRGWERLRIGNDFLRFAPPHQFYELCFRRDSVSVAAVDA